MTERVISLTRIKCLCGPYIFNKFPFYCYILTCSSQETCFRVSVLYIGHVKEPGTYVCDVWWPLQYLALWATNKIYIHLYACPDAEWEYVRVRC